MKASLIDLRAYLAIAASAARAAAILLLEDRIESREERDSSARDLKLRADLDAEAVILERLSRETKFPILSEEAYNGENRSDWIGSHWIVDPLDGTYNFGRKISMCCISIALWDGEGPLLGLVYDFNSDIMYEGGVGLGAHRNGVRMTVALPVVSDRALLFTGLPVAGDFSPRAIEAFSTRILRFKKVRMLGSAALSLSLVACGSGDVYYEEGIRIWDVAAGVAMIVAAGGCFSIEYCNKEKTICNVSAGSGPESMYGLKFNHG